MKVPQLQFSGIIADVLNTQVMQVAREQGSRRDDYDLLTSRRQRHKAWSSESRKAACGDERPEKGDA